MVPTKLKSGGGRVPPPRPPPIYARVRGDLDSAIYSYVPMKKQGKRSKKKHLSKRLSKRLDIKMYGFINIRERLKIMKFTKKH